VDVLRDFKPVNGFGDRSYINQSSLCLFEKKTLPTQTHVVMFGSFRDWTGKIALNCLQALHHLLICCCCRKGNCSNRIALRIAWKKLLQVF